MSASIIAILASSGVGAIAGSFIGVPGFLLYAALPTVTALTIAVFATNDVPVWVIPAAWILQQAAYAAVLQVGRPEAYRSLLARVRIMMGE